MKLVRRPPRAPSINLSPLIDVIFILLIFVVLVAKFADEERLDVDIPSAAAGRPAELDALFVEVTVDGAALIGGHALPRDGLLERFQEERRRFRRMVLVADRASALQSAVDVISAAKLAGFDAVAVATRPPEVAP